MKWKMSQEFLENWNEAKRLEEQGHKFFQECQYQIAAEKHQAAAERFKKLLGYIDISDEQNHEGIRKRVLGNYHIELANYYHSLATFYFYRGDKEAALTNYQHAIEEQKKSIQEYETLKDKEQYMHEINSLKIVLHFYLAYENLCLAQLAFLDEQYAMAIEYFKTAEIHTNLEIEFIAEINDLERLKRARARLFYVKGQISRTEALLAIQNAKREDAKRKYLEASSFFEDASKLYPEWDEYKKLAQKANKMAKAIRT